MMYKCSGRLTLDSVTIVWKLPLPHITSSQLHGGGNVNGISNLSPPRAVFYGNLCREREHVTASRETAFFRYVQ